MVFNSLLDIVHTKQLSCSQMINCCSPILLIECPSRQARNANFIWYFGSGLLLPATIHLS